MTSHAPNEKPAQILRFEECLERQFGLCRTLETLADSLPSRVDARGAVLLANRLCPTLRRCHWMEEATVFPGLPAGNLDACPIVERPRREHCEDEDHARDVRDAITAFASDPQHGKAEELGHMPRCLFLSLRRHLAFDRDHVIPLYGRSLVL